MTPAVSILIPSYRAEATIARAVGSLLKQTESDWECIIASDDGADYLAVLAAAGIRDDRLRQVSTGGNGSGEAVARNAALAAARGDFIANLDADDAYDPRRLALLLPLARRGGAATDNTAVHDEAGNFYKCPFPEARGPFAMDAAALLAPRVTFSPLFRESLRGDGWRSAPFAADVLFNLELLSRADGYLCHHETLYRYYKTPGSITHSADTARLAEAGYDRLLSMLARPDLPLRDDIRAAAVDEFAANRRLNRVFARFLAEGRCATLEEFLDMTQNGRALPPEAFEEA